MMPIFIDLLAISAVWGMVYRRVGAYQAGRMAIVDFEIKLTGIVVVSRSPQGVKTAEHEILRIFESDRGRGYQLSGYTPFCGKRGFPLEHCAAVYCLTHSMEVQQVGRMARRDF